MLDEVLDGKLSPMHFASPLVVAYRAVLAYLPQLLLGGILRTATQLAKVFGQFLRLFSQPITRGRHVYPFERWVNCVTTESKLLSSAQGRAGGGFSPVCLISFSVVMVVFPPGVVISVSVFVVDFSAQPIKLIEKRLNSRAEQKMRFM
jgi:hypothetical protein